MGIYSDKKIGKIINKRELVIHPYNADNLTGIGYDLTIGILRPLSKIEEFEEDEEYYYIPQNSYCIIISKEFVWLSKKNAGTLHARGTLAARGLYTNCTNIDPNFQGQLIMSIYNVSDQKMKIGKNEHYITMIVHRMIRPTSTLIGKDSKNSMRVTRQFKEIYGKEHSQTAELHEYLTESSTQYQNGFHERVANARHKFLKSNFSVLEFIIKLVSLRVLAYIAVALCITALLLTIITPYYELLDGKFLNLFTQILVIIGTILVLLNSIKKT